ncbi:unnamed protein product [Ectocarpus sp. CCAP 1310/34]|nr:unnamed protein product [Ectocarpus sp. CCAP 1310/34]
MSSNYNAIVDDQPGLRTFSSGKEDGPVVLFVHGWPDDHLLWDSQVTHLKDRFRCVTTDLPGFSGDDARVEKWGYSTEEVVKRIERTAERVGNGQPIILVAHDFGCMYSFKFEAKRPDLVRKMVAIDVGGAMKPSICGAMLMVTYQLWLCAAFFLGRPIGDGIARSFAWLMGSPSGARIARASTCYPYYHTWKHILCSGEKVRPMMPKCPLMFLHGTAGVKKIMTFHAARWAEKVQEKEGSSSQGIPQASHWVTRDQPEEVNRRLDEFLADI